MLKNSDKNNVGGATCQYFIMPKNGGKNNVNTSTYQYLIIYGQKMLL